MNNSNNNNTTTTAALLLTPHITNFAMVVKITDEDADPRSINKIGLLPLKPVSAISRRRHLAPCRIISAPTANLHSQQLPSPHSLVSSTIDDPIDLFHCTHDRWSISRPSTSTSRCAWSTHPLPMAAAAATLEAKVRCRKAATRKDNSSRRRRKSDAWWGRR